MGKFLDPKLMLWDMLDLEDKRHNEQLYCIECNKLIHDAHNEDYYFWFDTQVGPVCVECCGFGEDYNKFFKLQQLIVKYFNLK